MAKKMLDSGWGWWSRLRDWRRRASVLAVLTLAGAGAGRMAGAQGGTTIQSSAPVASTPAEVPGKGLAEHDFFYAGEGTTQRMYIVRGGKVVWMYDDPTAKGEISDAMMLSNGNILFAHQFGVTEITPEKKVIWNYDAPPGTEIHTAVAIGRDHVLFVQNGSAPKAVVVDKRTSAVVKELPLLVGNTGSVHGQFRRARVTDAGTLLVAHMDRGRVVEYASDGKVVWSYAVAGPWDAERLKNGNTLITSSEGLAQEVNAKGEVVWQMRAADLPGYRITQVQTALRLSNGDTLMNNWGSGKTDAQAIEVTPEKKVAWVLRSWEAPADLGRSTTIQILDEPGAREDVHFGSVR